MVRRRCVSASCSHCSRSLWLTTASPSNFRFREGRATDTHADRTTTSFTSGDQKGTARECAALFLQEEKINVHHSYARKLRGSATPLFFQINGELAQLTWRSPNTLVIGATDARHIVKTHVEDGMRVFVSGDADDSE